MPVDSGSIAGQVGASGGLWTHTPVDYHGNEGITKPGSWPSDAALAVPPNGSTGSAVGTAGPIITAISSGTITTSGATISFTTSQSATSYVEYGPTTAYGQTTATTTGNGAQTRPITGLASGTIYHYRVVSQSSGGPITYSGDRTFTTA